MKIVIDARIINSSTGRYIERLLTYLEKIDKNNEYKVLVPTKDLGYWAPTNPNFSLIACDYKNYSLGEQLGFCWQLYRLNADLVHFCMPQQPLLYFRRHVTTVMDMTLLKIIPSNKNPVVFRVKQTVGRFVFFWVGHLSSHVITISKFTRDEYIKYAHISINKTTNTYLSADLLSTSPQRPAIIEPNLSYILFVGQQNDHKNVPGLMKAHQKLLKQFPDLHLVFAGKIKDGVLLNKQLSEAEFYKNIVFTDFISDDELAWLYEHTLASIVPAFIEGFGLPGLEAIAHGAPLVSSNTSCMPEIYGMAAHYFNPYSTDDMSIKISEVIGSQSKRKELIKAGRVQIKKYSWHKMAKQTKAVYDSVLESTM